jgi:hypothetical protein
MSLQADIKWIQSEIEKVNDPFLVEAFKNLLNYRKQNQISVVNETAELYIKRALKSEDDIANGRLLSRKEMDLKSK